MCLHAIAHSFECNDIVSTYASSDKMLSRTNIVLHHTCMFVCEKCDIVKCMNKFISISIYSSLVDIIWQKAGK